jgi:hemoglobin
MSAVGGDLYQAMGGTAGCRKLSEAFYTRVRLDPVLRPLFPGKSMRCAIEAFTAFLVQFLGGPPGDTSHRWWLSLRESHLRFKIAAKERDAWMRLMRGALADAGIAEPAHGALLGLFEQSSAYLVNQGKPVASEARLESEVARRWDAQRKLDQAVSAVRRGDADEAMKLAGSAGCNRSVLARLLALMIGHGGDAMLDRVEQQLRADPALTAARYFGFTLMHAAAGASRLRIVEALLELGADPNALDSGGHTPLYALGNGCIQGGGDVACLLIRAGADVNASGGVKHCTPLHMAARRGNVEVAAALLDCGAQIDARDSQGVTPLQRALNCRKPAVTALLRVRANV